MSKDVENKEDVELSADIEQKKDDIPEQEKKESKIQEEATSIERAIKKIEENVSEEDNATISAQTFLKIFGGDILTTQVIRRQIWLILLIVFFIFIYISNRYSVQKDLIEIDSLQTKLQDAKYKALSSSSQITEKSRESHILELLKNDKDSSLKIANQPPFIINVPEGE